MRLFWGVLLLCLSFSVAAVENGKIISDIDGTLRRTHVRARGFEGFSLIWQAFVGNNYFSGMPEILQDLSGQEDGACFGQGDSDNNAVSYVTAAPALIQFVGRRFLRKSCFPHGSYHPRPYLFGGSKEHKFETIRALIEESGSENVLLIGDNGEHDIDVYDRVTQTVVGAQVDVFIHMVYSEPKGRALLPGQRPFLTGADLAAQLYELGWISEQTFFAVVDVVHSDIFSEGGYERVFPRWMDCKDFVSAFRWPVMDLAPEMMSKILDIDQAMGDRCFRADSIPIHTVYYEAEEALQCAEVLL